MFQPKAEIWLFGDWLPGQTDSPTTDPNESPPYSSWFVYSFPKDSMQKMVLNALSGVSYSRDLDLCDVQYCTCIKASAELHTSAQAR
jgi:hypothetical protein